MDQGTTTSTTRERSGSSTGSSRSTSRWTSWSIPTARTAFARAGGPRCTSTPPSPGISSGISRQEGNKSGIRDWGFGMGNGSTKPESRIPNPESPIPLMPRQAIGPELIEHRSGQARDRPRPTLFQVQNDDLIRPRVQPRAREIECLLRPDVPIAAEVVAVHPDVAFPPASQIQERVSGPVYREGPAIERWPAWLGQA